MGYHHDAAALRRSAEKARQQMDGAWNPDMLERFEAIAIQLEHEAATIEGRKMHLRGIDVLI